MTETTIINVLPCCDVAYVKQDQAFSALESAMTKESWQEFDKWATSRFVGTERSYRQKPEAKDRIGQDVVVGDVLWWHGKFGTVDQLDHAMGMARLDGVDGRWAALDDAIRCPRPCQHMPQFANWTKLRDAMLVDGADIQMLGGEGVGSMHKNWIRVPDCTWRKPHPGAELKDAQAECVGF